nr:reverse transcriptase [Tanacetum cinerariifolium]
KANVVADALSRKSGMVAGIKVEEEIIRDLERLGIKLFVSGQQGYWASLRIKPDLISRIKEAQKEDITPTEPIDSLSMGDEHLNTIPATKSDELIKSCVENLVPNLSVKPLIDHHCCYECGNSLNDFFCTQCTCEFCGNGAYKILACCDDDDDYNSAITPNEPIDSLSIGDEHLNTIPAMEPDEFIKSCVENLVLNPSEFKGENGCDMPAFFTTFSNTLFDTDHEFDSINDQSCSDEDISEKIISNPLFEEEIIPMKIDQHHFNAESDLIESLLNRIDETDCYLENEICLIERLLYDNSSPRPPEEFVSENSNAKIKSFSSSPIPVEDSDSFIEEIDLSFNPDDPMPPGIEKDDDDSERDILIREELLDNYSLSLYENKSLHFDFPSFFRPPAKPPDCNT